MSSHESPVNELDRPTKRRIQRRHGACEPCRSSKTKCDGRTPCGSCRSERRRQCPCVYSEKAMKLQLVTAEIRLRAESEKKNNDGSLKRSSEDETRRRLYDGRHDTVSGDLSSEDTVEPSTTCQGSDQACIQSDVDNSARMLHTISVCAIVDEFKRLRTTVRGYSAQIIAKCDGLEVAENTPLQELSRVVVSSRPSQSLLHSVNATPSPMEVWQALKTRLDAIGQLVSNGCLSRAWVDIGSLVREGQLMEATLNKNDSSPTVSDWRQTWSSILDLEAQIGLTIGRPTCVLFSKKPSTKSTIHTLSLEDSLDDTRLDLYQHIQGMLGLDFLTSTAIRDFLERARDVVLHEPFNQVGLCTTAGHSPAVRDLHLNTHLFLMVIYCRMASLCDLFSHDLTNSSWSETPAADIIRSLSLHQPRQKLLYCRKMFRSANFILDSFTSLHHRDGKQTSKSWMRCHAAYIAVMILGIAKLRHEVDWHATTDKINGIAQIFLELRKDNSECQLFDTAIARIRDLNSVKEPASETGRNKSTHTKSHTRSPPHSIQTSPRDPRARSPGVDEMSTRTSPTIGTKRSIDMAEGHTVDSNLSQGPFVNNNGQETDSFQAQAVSGQTYDDSHLGHLSLFEDNSATYSEQSRHFTNTPASSSATSFCGSDMSMQAVSNLTFNHPGPPFAYPFPCNVFHPPMTWNNTMFHMPNHDSASMSVQLTGIPQYGMDASPMPSDLASEYGLQSASTTRPSVTHSLQPSPIQPSDERPFDRRRLTPPSQEDARYANTTQLSVGLSSDTMSGRSFLQPIKTPTSSNDLSEQPRRPSLDRRDSGNKLYPLPALNQGNRNHSAAEWQPTSAITPASNIHPHVGRPVAVSRTRRRASIDHNPHQGLCVQHERPESHYTGPIVSAAPGIIGNHICPTEQMTYLDPATGMFEQQHLHGQYQHHLPTYARYVVPDQGQFQEEWRRMSIDTGGSSGTPF